MTKQQGDIRTAGRGLLSITGAKLYFIVASYAVQLLLPRLLDGPESFGLYSKAITAISILNNLLIAGTVQSVSKLVSEDEDRAAETLRGGLRILLVVGTLLGGGLFLSAPALAAGALLDPAVGPLLRVASAVVLAYSLYAVLVGSLNGRRLFQRQAALDATFSTLRTAGIVGAAALGFGALGAVSGFATAAVSILLVALAVVGVGRAGEGPSLRRWLLFVLPLFSYHFFLNMMMLSDLLVLSRTVAEIEMETGITQTAAAEVGSRYAGFYRAAQTFAFVPYQLILSMTFVVFPTISKATSVGDGESTRTTIRGAMRFSLLVLLSIAAPIAGAADGVMRIAYPDEYLAGAPALGILVLGIVMFALFVISATILSGAGRPVISLLIAVLGVGLVVGANRVLVLAVGVGDRTLPAAALATTLGMGVAMLVAGAIVYRGFGAWLPPASVFRSGVAAAVAFFVARVVPHGHALMAVVALALGFFAFLAVLVLFREVGKPELAIVRRVLGRG